MERQELIRTLSKLKTIGYVLESEKEYDELAEAMFEWIGDSDPTLRDSLIYEGYVALLEKHKISRSMMKSLWKRCQDEKHLLLEQGSKTGDSIYVRSFCTLLLVCLVETHLEKPFLQAQEIKEFLALFCECYEKEKNLLGYTEEKGWAHFAAHGADLLDSLAKCKELTKNDIESVLKALRTKICQGEYVYIDNEPWRMGRSIISIMDRNIFTEEELNKWLHTLMISNTSEAWSIEAFHARMNKQNFMRALYFMTQEKYKCVSEYLVGQIEK